MFPLKTRIIGGYSFGVKTSYNSRHLGVDYKAHYTELYAPFDGRVERHDGNQGGITLWFYPHGLPVIRFMHLSDVKKTGEVKEGDLIAKTGNTGELSTSPHLHLDISKTDQGAFWQDFNNFIDPETFDWGKEDMIPKELTEHKIFVMPDGRQFWFIPSADAKITYIGDVAAEPFIYHDTADLEEIEGLKIRIRDLSNEVQTAGDTVRKEMTTAFKTQQEAKQKEYDEMIENITEQNSLKIQDLENNLKKKETCKQSTGQSNTGKTLFKSIWEWLGWLRSWLS
jgi:hypothetical protein